MWCEHCQSDVAAEFAVDGHSLLCTSCRQPIRPVAAQGLRPETQSAREFLERWTREQQQQLESQASIPTRAEADFGADLPDGLEYTLAAQQKKLEQHKPAPAIANDATADAPAAIPPKPVSKLRWRVDSGHQAPAGPRAGQAPAGKPRPIDKIEQPVAAIVPEPVAPVIESIPAPAPPQPRRTRIDAGHTVQSSQPHFDVRLASTPVTQSPGRSEAMWGQLLAYLGVGGLTGGAVLVLWGYFGGIETYASTGWLVTTAGQMVLLLGIVTLVGGGMQQTTHEVTQRIEHLGGRMIRIEQSTDKLLKGPYYARSRKRARRKQHESAEGEVEG